MKHGEMSYQTKDFGGIVKNSIVGTVIKTFPDPILLQVSEPWDFTKDEIGNLPKRLYDAMQYNDGIGIAAPQIGINKRVIIVCDILMFNPTFRVRFDLGSELVMGWEGCLSLPGQTCLVERHTFLEVVYFNFRGEKQQIFARDFQARIVQHEVDHLDGKLIGGYQ